MAVKYHCPKCGRRFAEWGAEKLGFQCPHDDLCPHDAEGEAIELVKQGSQDDGGKSKPSLKRKAKAKRAVAVAPPVSTSDDDELIDAPAGDEDFAEVDGDDEEAAEDVAEEEEVEVGVRRPIVPVDDEFDEDAEEAVDGEPAADEDVESIEFEGEEAGGEDFEEER
ncbi:MAG: hypothetical protein IT368_12165 [Candidatus Hydrogenedentes bacterium]|nr:hypothetical protein [Candidatus Hydrogenedentota bacterium]